MSTTLLTTGLACIIAAIIGGGLKAFGIEIPTLQSGKRQGLLATFGLILTIAAYYVQAPVQPPITPREIIIFETKNDKGVLNNPPQPTEFNISQPHYITEIWNYHWNDGQGTIPGNISLKRNDGKPFGPWEVNSNDLASKQNWICKPNVTIPAGNYTIVDSDPATWSWNDKTGRMGMSKVKGFPVKGTLDVLWYWLGF